MNALVLHSFNIPKMSWNNIDCSLTPVHAVFGLFEPKKISFTIYCSQCTACRWCNRKYDICGHIVLVEREVTKAIKYLGSQSFVQINWKDSFSLRVLCAFWKSHVSHQILPVLLTRKLVMFLFPLMILFSAWKVKVNGILVFFSFCDVLIYLFLTVSWSAMQDWTFFNKKMEHNYIYSPQYCLLILQENTLANFANRSTSITVIFTTKTG